MDTSRSARKTSWIVPPPQLCVLCRSPLTIPAQISSWNGEPAHRDCVRIHLLQRDPAFRDWQADPATPPDGSDPADEEMAEGREDDEEG